MKNWIMPMAVGQAFAANEYVSACYRIYCQSPRDNASVLPPRWDTNGNGVYDDTDAYVVTPPGEGYLIHGCDGYHDVRGESAPSAPNALVKHGGDTLPVYVWFGDVIGSVDDAIDDFHFADLTVEGAVIDNGNKS